MRGVQNQKGTQGPPEPKPKNTHSFSRYRENNSSDFRDLGLTSRDLVARIERSSISTSLSTERDMARQQAIIAAPLSREEIRRVLLWLNKRVERGTKKQSEHYSMNRAIFRMALLGMRSGEIGSVLVKQVRLSEKKPVILVKGRVVPVWWVIGAIADLQDWYDKREALCVESLGRGQSGDDYFVSSHTRGDGTVFGTPLTASAVNSRFKTCVDILGDKRRRELSVTSGRHTFIKQCLLAGRSVHSILKACGAKCGDSVHLFRAQYLEKVDDPYGL